MTIAEQAPHTDGDRLAASMLSAILDTEAVLRNDPLLPAELLGADWAASGPGKPSWPLTQP